MKTLITLALFAVCRIVSAEPFDMKLCTTVLLDGKPYADGCLNYHDLEAGDIEVINKKTDHIVQTAINTKDSKGPFTVILGGSMTDTATGKATPADDIKVSGLLLRDIAKILRAEHKAGDELIKLAEGHAAKGKNKPWGKSKD